MGVSNAMRHFEARMHAIVRGAGLSEIDAYLEQNPEATGADIRAHIAAWADEARADAVTVEVETGVRPDEARILVDKYMDPRSGLARP